MTRSEETIIDLDVNRLFRNRSPRETSIGSPRLLIDRRTVSTERARHASAAPLVAPYTETEPVGQFASALCLFRTQAPTL